jgi:branched-chain amino acid transport system permease protein
MLGASLAGIAGALLASVVSVVPTMGQGFIASAFMTVIVAGPAVISGTAAAAVGLAVAQSLGSFWQTAVIGQAVLLLVAVVVLRVRPNGISATWRRHL